MRMKLTISKGEQVRIWYNPWIPGTILSKSSFTIDYDHCEMGYLLEYYLRNGTWRLDFIQNIYGQAICDTVVDIPIDRSLSQDKFGWGDDFAIRPRISEIISAELIGDLPPSQVYMEDTKNEVFPGEGVERAAVCGHFSGPIWDLLFLPILCLHR